MAENRRLQFSFKQDNTFSNDQYSYMNSTWNLHKLSTVSSTFQSNLQKQTYPHPRLISKQGATKPDTIQTNHLTLLHRSLTKQRLKLALWSSYYKTVPLTITKFTPDVKRSLKSGILLQEQKPSFCFTL